MRRDGVIAQAAPAARALLRVLAEDGSPSTTRPGVDCVSRPAMPRTMLVAAHPDDETVGAGSRLERMRDALLVFVTDGAPRDGQDAARHGLAPEGYAALRERELRAALGLCGIGEDRIRRLDCPDQQASMRLATLARRLAALMAAHRTEAVLTHPYEGGHPDHDATAFAVHAAAALLHRQAGCAPALVEMTSYHLGPDGFRPCEFLPASTDGDTVTVHLTPGEQARKQVLLACHASQRDTLRLMPTHVERFRPAPRYDFTRPPHDGALFYEMHPWGLTGGRFRTLASEALRALDLEPAT